MWWDLLHNVKDMKWNSRKLLGVIEMVMCDLTFDYWLLGTCCEKTYWISKARCGKYRLFTLTLEQFWPTGSWPRQDMPVVNWANQNHQTAATLVNSRRTTRDQNRGTEIAEANFFDRLVTIWYSDSLDRILSHIDIVGQMQLNSHGE